MRTFAQKQNPSRQSIFLKRSNAVAPDHNEDAVVDTDLTGATHFGHDFSRIPVHAQVPITIQSKLAVNIPGDIYEREADRVAEQVLSMPESLLQRTCAGGEGCAKSQTKQPDRGLERLQTKGVRASDLGETVVPPIANEVLHSSGQPLDPATRAFMELRFGYDFSQVRVHSGIAAEQSAQDLNAYAYTLGHDLVFGAGQFAPGTHEGRRLIAHELTHVVQQSYIGPALQPKLKFTGKAADVSRVITLLNNGLQNYSVSADKSGNVDIKKNVSKQKINPQQQSLATRLTIIINDPKTVTISVSAGSKTLGGTFKRGDIDIADLETYGVSGLIHEIWEQYQGQVKGLDVGSETTGAHAEGIKAESEVTGAKRGAQKIISYTKNPDKTIDAVIEIPFTYPDGKVKIMVMTVKKSNIVSFMAKP